MPLTEFDLTGRVALVTGAAGHLGRAMAGALAEAGAQVLLNGRRPAALEAVRDDLIQAGYSAEIAAFDVTDETAVVRGIDAIASAHRRLDILVNNAYAGGGGGIDAATSGEFANSYDVAVTAAFRLIQRGKGLLEAGAQAAGSASVINIASMYGSVSPDPRIYGAVAANPPFYGAAKAGLLQLTRYLACHLAPAGVRVNAISPGPFPADKVATEAPDFVRALTAKVPLGRIGKPADLRGAVVFLASDASRYVTGINLPVDGGWTAW